MPPRVLPAVAVATADQTRSACIRSTANSAASELRGSRVAARNDAAKSEARLAPGLRRASIPVQYRLPMRNDYLERILKARVYDVAMKSPLDFAPALSRRLGNRLLLKREDLQPVFSFKLRGAYNKMAKMTSKALGHGVIAASAGNHAQGVGLAAQRLGCKATIVMPTTTPRIKIDAVTRLGAQVVLQGDTYTEAYQHARRLGLRQKLVFVHPYDDPDVIAGQGTIGMGILSQSSDPIHAIFVPIGGGGLISGIAAYVKRLQPSVKIIGVEPVDADAMARSLKAGRRVALENVGLF